MRFIFAAALAVAFALVSTPATAASVAEPSGASQIAPLGPDHREGKVSGLGEGRHHVRPDRLPTAVLSAQNEERGTRAFEFIPLSYRRSRIAVSKRFQLWWAAIKAAFRQVFINTRYVIDKAKLKADVAKDSAARLIRLGRSEKK
ncbi:unnamed protein product [Hyaloperonospora brassicae]|uniref:RxLR effector candidate protein n=1 Tax=Hyaloperonospora brassicae TaxID=162125 RepID=A0AAV0U399_HYABA|nr:unnamed protein product [Hyaloperonospora brassicae]